MAIQIDDDKACHNYKIFSLFAVWMDYVMLFSHNGHKNVHFCFYCFFLDKMGKKHHTGGAPRILAFLVVVSVNFLLLIFGMCPLPVPAAGSKKFS